MLCICWRWSTFKFNPKLRIKQIDKCSLNGLIEFTLLTGINHTRIHKQTKRLNGFNGILTHLKVWIALNKQEITRTKWKKKNSNAQVFSNWILHTNCQMRCNKCVTNNKQMNGNETTSVWGRERVEKNVFKQQQKRMRRTNCSSVCN